MYSAFFLTSTPFIATYTEQQLHNIKSLLALRQEQQGASYQGNTQNSEMERIFQERMRAVAAAALARSQNDNLSQQQRVSGLEMYQRLQQQHQQLQQQQQQQQYSDGQSHGNVNSGYRQFHR